MMITYDDINNNGYDNGIEINYTNTSADDYKDNNNQNTFKYHKVSLKLS